MSSDTTAPKKLLIKPIIISNKKKMLIKSPQLLANIKLSTRPIQQYKEEVIYASSNCDFLKGESQDVLIKNRVNLITKTCRTVAKCTSRGKSVEITSDNVCSVIGQKNYETVLSALSSVFNEETKVRGILALLSTQKLFTTTVTQTEMDTSDVKKCFDRECQTVDTRLNMFVKEKQRKRIRRQPLTPYVVTDRPPKVKKFIINIDDVKKEPTEKLKEKTPSLPDLKFVDEDSNMSCGSNLSLSSLPSVTGILDNPQGILNGIDKVTDKTLKPTGIPLKDGSVIMVPIKPEDDFHIATPEILKNVTHDERLKLIWHQAFVDFKLCLEQDEDGYYPLHIAVLSNDADLVRRQCAALRAKHESVDLPAGASGLTALHMSVRQNASTACTNILLQNGADPLLCDQDRRSSLHLAAEIESPQLRCILNYCDMHARSVLKNNLDFWRPEHESRTDDVLKKYLYECASQMFDDQGYTPLMLAAEAAIPSNVSLLSSRAGALLDAAAPTCGATALYRAVAKACLRAKEIGNRMAASDKLLKTIEILVEHGADPSIENHSGSSVNTLLTEYNISALSLAIANKMTSMRHGKQTIDYPNKILYKNNDGSIMFKDINNITDDTTEVTEVRNIPPGLHAIITIDVPKRECGKRRTSVKYVGKDISESELKTSESQFKTSESEFNTSGSEFKTSESEAKSDEMNVEFKGVKTSGLNDLMDNAIKDRNVIKGANELTSFLVKANSLKDVKCKNTNIQLKLSDVVLKKGKTNINMGIKDSLNNLNVDKRDILKQMNRQKVAGINIVKDINADNAKGLNDTDKIINTKTTDKNVKTDDQNPKNADKNIKDDADSKMTDKTTKMNLIKTTEGSDSNQKPSRSENTKEKVVIVQNVALKKVFPFPNILKASKSNLVKARDIVISPKVYENPMISQKITDKNDEFAPKIRKRKLE